MSSEDKVDSGLAAEKGLAENYNDEDNTDVEGTKKKIPYPKSVIFIVVCEFCERFNYYGMRAILTLYFKNVLKFDEDFATVIYHLFTMFCYFTPLLGAMLADSLLGKFRTIFYLAVVYAIGSVILTLAATPPISLPEVPFSMIGLALIAIGTGGIKPCVSAFGGDQFQIPGQEDHLASYFAIFYFAINGGSLISTTVTPIFREDVHCFGDDTCYPLAFSVPAALMVVALVIFLLGRPSYKIVEPTGNVVLQVLRAIKYALSRRSSEKKAGREREHWMDYADDKFDPQFVTDTKTVLKVLFLYIPLPLFWALFDQQGSRWTFQATRMDGNTFGYLIKPDQLQVVNPLLVLAFIPIFDRLIYPLLSKCGILKKPLQRLTVGGIFAGIAFAVSGIVELALENTYALELQGNQASLHFVNTLPCDIILTRESGLSELDSVTIPTNMIHLFEAIESSEANTTEYGFKLSTSNETACAGLTAEPFKVLAYRKQARTYMIYREDNAVKVYHPHHPDELEKAEDGEPLLRVMYHNYNGTVNPTNVTINGRGTKSKYSFTLETNISSLQTFETEHEIIEEPGEYTEVYLEFTDHETKAITQLNLTHVNTELQLGGNYIMTIVRNGTNPEDFMVGIHTITDANSMHMFLLLPQFIIMTAGEIMFSITIMDFSYAEAPATMKSVMQSAWLMTVAFGNLIVVIIAEAKIFKEQSKEFFLFAGLMLVDMLIFSYMAYIYVPAKKPVSVEAAENDEDGKENEAYEKQE